jgi:predicted RNA-binding protein with PUA-like domain
MAYFLAKTDPETYSIDDLERDGTTIWDGVHSYEAIAVIKSWKVGDKIFVYHSQGVAKIMGLMEVVGEPYKDPNDPRNISWAAKVKFVSKFPEEKQVSLKEIKESGKFSDFKLVKQGRLSTMACPENFVEWMSEKLDRL